jgi:hypothetical protein
MRQNGFTIMPQHHHAMTQKFSRNDRAAHQSLPLQQQHGAERMNLKLLATAAAIAALAATTAQAQQPTAPGQKMQQGGSVSGTHGASGAAPGQRMHENGSATGTVGASGYAPGQAGADVKAGTGGSVNSRGTGATGSVKAGGSAR